MNKIIEMAYCDYDCKYFFEKMGMRNNSCDAMLICLKSLRVLGFRSEIESSGIKIPDWCELPEFDFDIEYAIFEREQMKNKIK